MFGDLSKSLGTYMHQDNSEEAQVPPRKWVRQLSGCLSPLGLSATRYVVLGQCPECYCLGSMSLDPFYDCIPYLTSPGYRTLRSSVVLCRSTSSSERGMSPSVVTSVYSRFVNNENAKFQAWPHFMLIISPILTFDCPRS